MSFIYETPEEMLQEYNLYLKEQKSEGKKIIGYLAHEFFPEEIIRAANAIPVPLIFAGDEERTNSGSDYLTNSMCPYALSQIGAFEEKNNDSRFRFLSNLDAVVGTNYCAADHLVNEWISDLNSIKNFKFHIPFLQTKAHISFYNDECQRLASELCEFTDNEVNTDIIWNEIQTSQKMTLILKKIFSSNLKGSVKNRILQQTRLFSSSQEYFTNISNFTDSLTPYLNEKNHDGIPVILAGAPAFIFDDIIEFIEECGGSVIVDETWLGNTWINKDQFTLKESNKNVEWKKDPFNYLTHRFGENITSLHCSPKTSQNYIQEIIKSGKKYEIKAVIFHIIKFCDLVGHHRHDFKNLLNENGFSVLNLERDYSKSMRGQLRTRIEAFLEMITF